MSVRQAEVVHRGRPGGIQIVCLDHNGIERGAVGLIRFDHDDPLLLEYDARALEEITILARCAFTEDHIDLVADTQHDARSHVRFAE